MIEHVKPSAIINPQVAAENILPRVLPREEDIAVIEKRKQSLEEKKSGGK